MKCGLLGRKLSHSYSPEIHSFLGSYDYKLIEKEPEALPSFLTGTDFHGLNVTIPYKKDVIPYCAALTPRAEKIGAVNTIVRQADGTLLGHNTDYFGFSYLVDKLGISVSGKKALVLGSGGASNTAVAVLEELGAQVVVISRTGENNYHNLSLHQDARLIVNATPVGMYPGNGTAPVDLGIFPDLEGVLDMIYNPARTALLLDAEKRGIPAENGLWMLVAQAKESAEWFTGTKIPDSEIARIHGLLRRRMENIILIGMPGCGKSTVGALLAGELGREFADADERIVEIAGMPISEIFRTQGEASFRHLEALVLAELGKQSRLVISTGGGCVTREENYPALRQNGTVFWIHRDPDSLPTAGRPLSQGQDLARMLRLRLPLYQKFADRQVFNNSSPQDCVLQIREAL